VPIVGVTAMARVEDRQACLEAGMTAQLSKPVDRPRLLQTLREVLDASRWAQGFHEAYDNPSSDFSRVSGGTDETGSAST
jgi:DNA-binding response OmpR family regulator